MKQIIKTYFTWKIKYIQIKYELKSRFEGLKYEVKKSNDACDDKVTQEKLCNFYGNIHRTF